MNLFHWTQERSKSSANSRYYLLDINAHLGLVVRTLETIEHALSGRYFSQGVKQVLNWNFERRTDGILTP